MASLPRSACRAELVIALFWFARVSVGAGGGVATFLCTPIGERHKVIELQSVL